MSAMSDLPRRLSAVALLAASLGVASFAVVPAFAGDDITSAVGQGENAPSPEDMKPIPAVIEPLSASVLINAVAKVGDGLVAVGSWGHVLISADMGKTWTQVETPVNVTLTSVRFVDAKLGFATGHDATIIRTEDGGKTWSLVQYDPAAQTPLFDLYMKDAQSGFAIGAYSLVMTTADGGKTWQRKEVGDLDLHMNALTAGTDGKVWIAGEAGNVFVADPDLKEIKDIETPYNGSFWNILALKDGSMLAMGLRGNIWRTTDGGATWAQAENSSIASLQSGVQLHDGRIVLVGLEGTVVISSDGGKSFTPLKRNERTGLTAALETADGKVLLFGEAGVDGTLTN
ncbi:WD40/YVTN/BNR-like repeat-containing protein [Zavarzinia sp.]|uniref:WD40/YVTN/BNR-like repeat-containing protein n=1 Tax=Zavarzinia sp. TaxID=2027920 RepID=UPI003568BD4C